MSCCLFRWLSLSFCLHRAKPATETEAKAVVKVPMTGQSCLLHREGEKIWIKDT